MPPTAKSNTVTAYAESFTHRHVLSAGNDSRDLGTQTIAIYRINGPRVNSAAFARRYRPLSLSKFPLRESGARPWQTLRTRTRAPGHFSVRGVADGRYPPTVTAEHDPNPPPLYTHPIPLHASIIPLATPGTDVALGAPDNRPNTRGTLSTPDIIIVIIIALLGAALVVTVVIIYRIRHFRHTKETNRIVPVKNGPRRDQTTSSWQVCDHEVTEKPCALSLSSTDSVQCFQAVDGRENHDPIHSTPYDVPQASVSPSISLDTESCTESSQPMFSPSMAVLLPSPHVPTREDFQEKLHTEEIDIAYSLSYAASCSEVSEIPCGDALAICPKILDAIDELATPDLENSGTTTQSSQDISVNSNRNYFEVETPCSDTLTVGEFCQVEIARSQSLESTRAVLVHCPVASSGSISEICEVSNVAETDEKAGLASPSFVGSGTEGAILSTITDSESFEASRNSLAQTPSLMVTLPSSGHMFSLDSSSSTVTVDLNDFPPPPALPVPRVEVTLPQVNLDFPVYVWDEDSDMLTVHKTPGPVLDQFISMYS